MPALVFVRAPLIVFALVAGLAQGCQDPCVALAQRICNCEPTPADRRACQQERITNQQSKIEIDDADRAVCEEKLETCTCDALDRNDLEACGFVPEGSSE
jgi:hypothetical protein